MTIDKKLIELKKFLDEKIKEIEIEEVRIKKDKKGLNPERQQYLQIRLSIEKISTSGQRLAYQNVRDQLYSLFPKLKY
jgi:D-ribose pyranose/furanose isomerase RbsD